jgi:hypothetical protein
MKLGRVLRPPPGEGEGMDGAKGGARGAPDPRPCPHGARSACTATGARGGPPGTAARAGARHRSGRGRGAGGQGAFRGRPPAGPSRRPRARAPSATRPLARRRGARRPLPPARRAPAHSFVASPPSRTRLRPGSARTPRLPPPPRAPGQPAAQPRARGRATGSRDVVRVSRWARRAPGGPPFRSVGPKRACARPARARDMHAGTYSNTSS